MPTWKEAFTLIFVPHSGERKTFSVSVKWVTAFVILLLAFFFSLATLIFSGIGIMANPYRVQKQFASYQQKINRLRKQNKKFKRWKKYASSLQKKVARINNKQHLLARLTGFQSLAKVTEGSKQKGKIDFNKLSSYLQSTSNQNQKLKDIKEFVQKRTEILNNTPMMWPAKGWISSEFGYRKDPMGGQGRSFHHGIDIAAWQSSPIHATAAGKVTFSGWKSGYGKVVFVKHKYGFTSLYGHMSKQLVKKGEKIEKGQIVGRVGSTGHATGSHVHYEIRINDSAINPKPFLVEHYSAFKKANSQEE